MYIYYAFIAAISALIFCPIAVFLSAELKYIYIYIEMYGSPNERRNYMSIVVPRGGAAIDEAEKQSIGIYRGLLVA